MFDNIGKKIKTLTKVVCWIGMILTLALGIVLVAVYSNNVAIGIPIMVGGPLLCWIGSFLMYGFGELVDRTMSIEEMMRKGAYGAGSAAAGIPAPAAPGRKPSFPAPANPVSSAPTAVKPVPVSSAPASVKPAPAPVKPASASVKPAPAPVITVSSDGDFKYSVNDDGSVRITKYVGKATNVRVPKKLDGKNITALGDYAFSEHREMIVISIPDSVTSIGNGAFSYCASLRQIVLPEGITAIGGSAFYECHSLEDICIPGSVTSIGKYAFNRCVSLKEIRIPGGVTSIGDNTFSGCPDLTLVVTPGSYAEQYCKDNGLKYRLAD